WANDGDPGYYKDKETGMEFETAKVIEVIDDQTTIDETTENVRQGSMELRLEILTGRYEGDVVETTNYFSSLYNVYVTEGDKVIVRVDTTETGSSASVYNYDRTNTLLIFVLFFLVSMVIIGGIHGFKSVLGLIFTLVCVFFLLIPLVLKGFPAIPTTVVILVITTIVCFLMIGGFKPKIIAAATGTIFGVVFAAILAIVVGNLTNISGFQMEEAESLLLIASTTSLEIKGLFICGVLIASLGAVMDIAMSISSAIEELHINNPSMTIKDLFVSGMNIGRDAMGTMSNTLILAFAGSSLNMIITIYSYGVPFTQLINTDFVAIELIRGIAGSMGIIFTVPAVSLIASWIIIKIKGTVFDCSKTKVSEIKK
ncbi:MAG: YibE/F family protein, partial [Coprobacillaceae bacterium]